MKDHKYLNVGCGNKFHKDWVNIDMVSHSEHVITANLLKGIPFQDNSFDVVYHSQVLEHFPKEKARHFMNECYRVLKPGGVIRVVVPDLENIVDEYKKYLTENIERPNAISEANYDWILLEMYDQTVRNYSGGQMAEFLQHDKIINEKYVLDRIGFVGRSIRNSYLSKTINTNLNPDRAKGLIHFIKRVTSSVKRRIGNLFTDNIKKECIEVGKFRQSGEIHMWMYDRFSLTRLLKESGFSDIKIKKPFESDIPDWNTYELDVKDGLAYDPTSLFVEAKK